MTFQMTYRKLTLLLASLLFTAGIGCSQTGTVPNDNSPDDTDDNTVSAETVALGEADFKGKEIEVITSLNIGANVGAADFAYLATLENLENITVDAGNRHFKSAPTPGEGGCVLWSGEAKSILYIPGSDDRIELDNKAISDSFKENSAVKLYVKGAVLDVKYNRGGDDDYWFVSRIEYGGKYINFADPLQFNGTRGLRVYDTEQALVFALGYSVWDHAIIFANDEMYEMNPEFGDFGADDDFRDADGCRLYLDANGKLRFESVDVNLLSDINDSRNIEYISSREQIWKREGQVNFDWIRPQLITERIYTADDLFASYNTNIDDWFAGLNTQYETLDELLEANRAAEKLDYTAHGINLNKYKKARTGVKNGVYTGYSMSYSFKNNMYPNEKFSFVMKIPQLTSTKPEAVKLNNEIVNKYFYINSTYIKQLEKSAKECSAQMNVSYATFKAGDVTVISIYRKGGVLGTGAYVDVYDVYYYDTANDKVLTQDEFIRRYTEDKLKFTDVLRMINELDIVKHNDEGADVVNEERFFGIIPDSKGRFYVLFEGYRIEGANHVAGYYDGNALAETDYVQKNA